MEVLDCDLVIRNGKEFAIADDGRVFNSKDKLIGWLIDNKYTPTESIRRMREKVYAEAQRRVDEVNAKKKALDEKRLKERRDRFEAAVQRRMAELNKRN
jgi:hypothetical protein